MFSRLRVPFSRKLISISCYRDIKHRSLPPERGKYHQELLAKIRDNSLPYTKEFG